jgi:ferrous iron transport protein B
VNPPPGEVAAAAPETAQAQAPARPIVLVAGNPNSGKSTLFNALTGAHVKVSNYPGVTVARTTGVIDLDGLGPVELVDLPGTYSLSARSQDEQVAVDAVLGRASARPDAVLIVADATALGRALYLAGEIIDTGGRVIVALNMVDEARSQRLEIDHARLAAELDVPVVPIVARTREGLDRLRQTMADALRRPPRPAVPLSLPRAAARDLDALTAVVRRELPALGQASRAWAAWALLSIDDSPPDELVGVPAAVRQAARELRTAAAREGRNLDAEIIGARYARVDALVARAVRPPAAPPPSWTQRIDGVLTHRVWGVLVFVVVMLALFQALFAWSEPAIALIEDAVAAAQAAIGSWLPPGPFRDLLVDGVVAGVGNVVVFVPQIGLLFLFIGVMEDAGYLARVAFVIDRVMGKVGLHGKSFVPMLSGFSCAVPAVMATRTLEHRTDRLLTMMVLPLMSCSARLPIYVLVIATVFGGTAPLWGGVSAGAVALFAMYALSVVAALTAAAVLRRTVLRGPAPTLLLELPPYRRPVARVLLQSTWRQVRSFLVDAGTIILALTIVMWALLSYPKDRAAEARVSRERAALAELPEGDGRDAAMVALGQRARGEQVRASIAGRVGRLMEPALRPLGLDWRVGIGILGAFSAREVFVSTLGIVFDVGEADEANQPLREALRDATRADGTRLLTPASGLALMVFFVLACQCMSTVAIVRRESGSWRWPLFMFGYQTALAYVAALVTYQLGRALGFAA